MSYYGRSNRGRQSNFDPTKARCFNCKRVGHIAATCRLPKVGYNNYQSRKY